VRLGDVDIARVEDYQGPGFEPAHMFPDFRPDMWQAERDWLVPRFYDPDADKLRTSIHSWLVRTPRHTILIDACIGNHKRRPSIERFHMRREPWLERLAAAGARPEEVDFVLCTHLHADHVGWNTRLENGRWIPTFPNARYLCSRADFERWDERRPDFLPRPINEFVFGDSILPVLESGQLELVDGARVLEGGLIIEPAPGHSPGHVTVRLRAGGREALFSGDVIHHPIQLPYPRLCSVFDEDRAQALATRLALLAECAAAGSVLLPTHFAAPYCCRLEPRDAAAPSYRPVWEADGAV
jgi:glyoxylase-like metal-dependent hydrolase (beta-lactamase superfamily II)